MDEITKEIRAVEEEIKNVEREIREIEIKIEGGCLSEKKEDYYIGKEGQLREKERQLREKERQLREKELRQSYTPRLHTINENQKDESSALTIERLVKDIQDLRMDVHKAIDNRDRATPQMSAASYGYEAHARLEQQGHVKKFIPIENEPSVLSRKDAASLRKLTREHHIVAFLTPHLEKIVQEDGQESTVLVNSEEFKWLKTSDNSPYNQKPDLFICHKAISKVRSPFQTQDSQLRDLRSQSDCFGILADWRLRRFLCLTCEAKGKVGFQGLGEVLNYAAHICFGDGPLVTHMVLFDNEQFWLVHCVKGIAASITKSKWSDGGSKGLLKEFVLRDPITEALDEACKYFQVTVDADSFLGEGAFGVVFGVQNKSGKKLALKVVKDENGSLFELHRQKEMTIQAKEKCPDFVVGIEDNGLLIIDGKAGCLLQSDVGSACFGLDKDKIIESLKALHSKDVLHGDCRVENVVSVSGKPKWIDFRRALLPVQDEVELSRSKQKEMLQLEQSILHHSDKFSA